jgi:hypothetical protein
LNATKTTKEAEFAAAKTTFDALQQENADQAAADAGAEMAAAKATFDAAALAKTTMDA